MGSAMTPTPRQAGDGRVDDMTRGLRRRRRGRSVAAVLLGFAVVVVLSLGTDQVLHVLQVYPPWGEPMREPGLNLLALAYRCVYTVLGMYLTATFAPHSPMRHALIAGTIGTAMGAAGAIFTIPLDLGPAWYPIAVAVTALPCAWLGAVLHGRRQATARQHERRLPGAFRQGRDRAPGERAE